MVRENPPKIGPRTPPGIQTDPFFELRPAVATRGPPEGQKAAHQWSPRRKSHPYASSSKNRKSTKNEAGSQEASHDIPTNTQEASPQQPPHRGGRVPQPLHTSPAPWLLPSLPPSSASTPPPISPPPAPLLSLLPPCAPIATIILTAATGVLRAPRPRTVQAPTPTP